MSRGAVSIQVELALLDSVFHLATGAVELFVKVARRLATFPGIGLLNATTLVAAIGEGQSFARGRDLSAWLGLVPRQQTTGAMTKAKAMSSTAASRARSVFLRSVPQTREKEKSL
jgi:transposase